jgi:hypothetical protein
MRAVCKVRGLRVGTLWRCGDGIFRSTSLGKRCISYNAPPTSRKHTVDRGFRKVVEQAVLTSWYGSKSPEIAWRRMSWWGQPSSPLEHPPYSPDLAPCDFWALPTISKPPVPLSTWSLRQTVCRTFSKSGWRVVRSASLAKGGISKKRPSSHLHQFPARSNKVSPRTLQSALVDMSSHHDSNMGNEKLKKRSVVAMEFVWLYVLLLFWVENKHGFVFHTRRGTK